MSGCGCVGGVAKCSADECGQCYPAGSDSIAPHPHGINVPFMESL